ncbi:MAG: hypothetical protein H6839_04185 [Planctomycetes bacterium]|nr:hypothetical protein [Planctomycetota bacterium]
MPEPTDTGADAPEPSLPFRDGDGLTPDLRSTFTLRPGTDVDDNEVRFMLDAACRLLWQITAITSGVLETVRTADVRAICAGDLPLSMGSIDGDGRRAPDTSVSASEATKPAPSKPERDPSTGSGRDPSTGSERDHRKAPRGRVHPLLMLVRLGVQAARLLRQIVGGTHPGVQNILTLDEKLDLNADKSRLAWERLDRRGPYHI